MDLFIAFFDSLNKHNISYIVLRGFEDLPHKYTNDIDFGVLPDDLLSFENLLRVNVIGHKANFSKVIDKYHYCKYQIILEDATMIPIDVWTDFNYRGLKYLDIYDMINTSRKYKSIQVPQKQYELALSFLKEYLHMHQIRKDKEQYLQALLDAKSFPMAFEKYWDNKRIRLFSLWINNRKLDESERFNTILTLVKSNLWEHGIFKVIGAVLSFLIMHLNNEQRKLF